MNLLAVASLAQIMDDQTAITTVGRAIQLSVAPVFLISGIGAMVAMMASRVSRVVDRARQIEGRLADAKEADVPALHQELATLSKRARLVNLAITFCTLTALLVCIVVASLFLGAFFGIPFPIPIAICFTLAMGTFFVALLCFLREIFVATANLRIGPR